MAILEIFDEPDLCKIKNFYTTNTSSEKQVSKTCVSEKRIRLKISL
jgi:hypothetical protein